MNLDGLVRCQPFDRLPDESFDGKCIRVQLLLQDVRDHDQGELDGHLLQLVQVLTAPLIQFDQASR